MNTRAAHWIPGNQQERMPYRMVAFDTESRFTNPNDETEIQTWRLGAAVRWRTNTKTDHKEGRIFACPRELWEWVTDFCHPGQRTVVWAHNLGYDVRISQVFTILPALGWHLEWCNLDKNVSSMTWRSDRGTLVFADTWTWLPLKLETVAPYVGMVKFDMPRQADDDIRWATYCMNDAEIVYHVVSKLCQFISDYHLGNWQPTGAGMSYTMWRHKFMTEKILVHADDTVIAAERSAMYTGRAEAWRHGRTGISTWTEVDMRTAYLMIARDEQLPRKLHSHFGRISHKQFERLTSRFAVLCYCRVVTDTPVLPYRNDKRILWPVGQWEGWYWDVEVAAAMRYGAKISILKGYSYAQAPILKRWAEFVLSILNDQDVSYGSVVTTFVKHCSRALIGRLSLRVPSWEHFGANPEGIVGITHVIMPEDKLITRMLHVGEDTLIETRKMEGRDSLPQVTGRIMAICRVRLWDAMNIAGLDHVAHVDTDSLIIDKEGLRRLKAEWGDGFRSYWQIKGTWRKLDIYGPRTYYRDGSRVAAGIPVKAKEGPDGALRGERWESLSASLSASQGRSVVVTTGTYHMKRIDPRRRDAPGVDTGKTAAYQVDDISSSSGVSSISTTGA